MASILNIVSGAPSGALNIALNIADYLGKYYKSEVLLRKYNRAGIDNVIVVKDRFTIDYIWGLCRYLERQRPDLIIVHGYSTHLWTKIAAALKRVPLIHVEHNTEKYTPLRQLLLRWLDRYTNIYICVSQGVAAHLIARGADAKKVKVIYNGVAAEQFQVKKIPHGDCFNIGMTARFSRQKDQLTLIRAVEYLYHDRKLPVRLILQGNGKYKQRCIDYVARQKLQEVVTFATGPIIGLLPQLDLFVLATHYEGFGLVICEAMAAGLPVIASDVPGVAEIIEHDKNGWLVPEGNFLALAEQIEMCYLQSRLPGVRKVAETGSQTVLTRFSMDKMRKSYKEVIDGLIKSLIKQDG